MTGNLFDETIPLDREKVVAIYERLRPYAPPVVDATPARHERLRDIIGNFDGLLLDGYGVLNTGGVAVDGAAALLADAGARGIETLVLTNGGSRTSAMIAEHYRKLGLEVADDGIVSSRDALMAAMDEDGVNQIGVVGGGVVLPDDSRFIALSPERPGGWIKMDAIGFFGATGWDAAWQGCLVDAMKAGVPVHVANADVAAPLEGGGFSREPGYWVAAALNDTPEADVTWYGKPHKAVFDLARKKMQAGGLASGGLASGGLASGRIAPKRIAMVGDTLHTDILGGMAKGLATVLVTGYGLFRDGGADAAIAASGITPDYIVERL